MALPLHVEVALGANETACDRVVSQQFEGLTQRKVGDAATGHWSDYVTGALTRARAQGWADMTGYDIALASEIPYGSGLSSSAAVIVGVLKCLAPADTADREIALSARLVENEYIGVPCGIMDQMAVAIGQRDMVLALDTDSLQHERVPVPGQWQISVVHSGVRRALADGRYKERQSEILAAAHEIGAPLLCRAGLDDIVHLPELLLRRARHVISEDRRTRQALACLRGGDIDGFGALMREGQRSIRDDLEITTAVIDRQVTLIERSRAVAARQTGGGFGGCLVVLSRTGGDRTWWHPLQRRFPDVRRIVSVSSTIGN